MVPRREKKKLIDDERYVVTVWNIMDGSIEKKLWNATYEEAEGVRAQYSDEPFCDVQVEEK